MEMFEGRFKDSDTSPLQLALTTGTLP